MVLVVYLGHVGFFTSGTRTAVVLVVYLGHDGIFFCRPVLVLMYAAVLVFSNNSFFFLGEVFLSSHY